MGKDGSWGSFLYPAERYADTINGLDFSEIPEKLKAMIPDYKINVINLCEIKDTSIFKTDLKYVIDFLKCRSDENAIRELIDTEEYYKHVDEDVFDVIASYSDTERMEIIKENYEDGGSVNMCEGLRKWMESERAEGLLNYTANG